MLVKDVYDMNVSFGKKGVKIRKIWRIDNG